MVKPKVCICGSLDQLACALFQPRFKVIPCFWQHACYASGRSSVWKPHSPANVGPCCEAQRSTCSSNSGSEFQERTDWSQPNFLLPASHIEIIFISSDIDAELFHKPYSKVPPTSYSMPTASNASLSSMLNPCPHECRYPVPNSSRANPSDNRQLSAPMQHERSLTYQGSANSRDERRCLPRELHPYTGTAPPERLPRLSELNNIPSTETATAQAQRHQSAQRGGLSVYESPTATYMWPRFDPEARPSQSNDSVIYVNYRPSPSLLAPLRNQLSSTASETGSSSTRSGSFECERDSGESHSSWSRKRSSSIESETSPSSPSDRFIKLPRVSQAQTESAGSPRHRATVPSPADFTRSPANGTDRELPVSFDALDIDSDQDHELDEARHPSPSASAHSTQVADEQSSRSSSVSAVTSFPSENSSGGNWMQYAEPPKVPGPMALYTCTWPIDNNFGTIMPCGYTSKRHLVKRHVESKHLQLRPCICPVCGKGFAQKSNLETHMNTHTGQTPHKCPYPNCEEYFKDPARRHRHMKAVHQHVSSRTKKNRMEVTVSAV